VLALLLVAVSVGLSNLAAAIGIGSGGVIGAAAGRRGEQLGGAILVAVGVAIAAGVL
jgi:hypothetical protein